jgi:hypothetical protein
LPSFLYGQSAFLREVKAGEFTVIFPGGLAIGACGVQLGALFPEVDFDVFLGVVPGAADLAKVNYKEGSCPRAEGTIERLVHLPTDEAMDESKLKMMMKILAK